MGPRNEIHFMQAVQRFICRMPTIIFYPSIILWSVLYGAIAGIFFKLVAVFENWWAINRLQLILWKKYPQRSYQKYITNIWSAQVKGQPVEMADYLRHRVEQDHPSQPFPFLRLLINTLAMIIVAPFMAISGIVEGPLFVYKQSLRIRKHKLISA